uniref:Uncharacterized protein n=1 Tax=Rhizophora mucronata TaxID=61149 RepID=A0A2P2Q1M0_RHIMU
MLGCGDNIEDKKLFAASHSVYKS